MASVYKIPFIDSAPCVSRMTVTVVACMLACVLPAVCIKVWHDKQYRGRLPPGPPALPIIGNLHQIPMSDQEYTFAERGKRYGGLVYARIFRKTTLVLNDAQTTRELLEKRSAKYSSRPHSVFAEIIDWPNLSNMPYGDRWRRHRRWFQNTLQARNPNNAHELLRRVETRKLLEDILREPEAILMQIKRYVAALILGIAYGYSPTSMDDEYIKIVEDTLHLVFEAAGLSSIVDFIPALRYLPSWMPGMEVKRRGLLAREAIRRMERVPLEHVKQEMAGGIARPSIATVLLEDATKSGTLDEAEEREMASALSIMYAVETDTTTVALTTFILMVLHPDVQRKAQAEIDTVIGDSRLPEFDDRAALPYLEAVIKEVYRFLGFSCPTGRHPCAHGRNEYNGFVLPKDSIVFTNLWAMAHDEKLYAEPETFDPERWLGLSGDKAEEKDPFRIIFGFGRRICPGRFLADSSIFLAIANIVANFDIRRAKTPDGKDIEPEVTFVSGVVRRPKPFVCEVRPRSARRAEMLMSEKVAPT